MCLDMIVFVLRCIGYAVDVLVMGFDSWCVDCIVREDVGGLILCVWSVSCFFVVSFGWSVVCSVLCWCDLYGFVSCVLFGFEFCVLFGFEFCDLSRLGLVCHGFVAFPGLDFWCLLWWGRICWRG